MAIRDDNKIRNIGPKSAAWLRQVGIYSITDVQRIGAVETYLKVKRAGFRASRNLLYALAGALADCHWTDLPEEEKARLSSTLDANELMNPSKTRWQKASAASEAYRNEQSPQDAEETSSLNFLDNPDASPEDANDKSGSGHHE